MEWRLVKPKRFQKLVAPIVTQEGRKSKGAFVGLGVRSLPFRVGQHIVCIDSWSGALPPSPRVAHAASAEATKLASFTVRPIRGTSPPYGIPLLSEGTGTKRNSGGMLWKKTKCLPCAWAQRTMTAFRIKRSCLEWPCSVCWKSCKSLWPGCRAPEIRTGAYAKTNSIS